MHTPTLKNGYGALRSVFEAAYEENGNGYSRTDLTVLSAQVDPISPRHSCRTPRRQVGLSATCSRVREAWPHPLARTALCHRCQRKHSEARRRIYRNTEADWLWLSNVAGKAARWLGYIPFERITDNRNAEPIIHRKARVQVETWVSIGLDVDIPGVDDIEPKPGASGFVPRQAFQFAIFGEKGSLEDVLLPLAE